MKTSIGKPRMVFFQWDHSKLPNFLRLHMEQHVKCLSVFFEVVLVNYNCDYNIICDIYQPEITLFESGFRSTQSVRKKIQNTNTHPQIPKIGFHNGDSWCDCRTGFLSDMELWNIETFFSISTTMAEHTPSIADNLFVWPNCIDSDMYRDYQMDKIIPFMFNGNTGSLYPWRQKIFKMISNVYPSLIFHHAGYESHSPEMIYGQEYSRTINASCFVPACGTVAKEVVRKHFEVPGSKSCLITEKSPSLVAAGFVDMKNCIFADEENLLDKLDFLLNNTEELKKITGSGFELVHTSHTLQQRDQIFQWFNLHKNLGCEDKIIQNNPFDSLCLVKKSSFEKCKPIICNGSHLILLREGDEKLRDCNYREAENLYIKSLNYISWLSEPKLKLAIVNLFQGKPLISLKWLKELMQANLGNYKAENPDPVEWAYYIITFLCQGKLNEAIIYSNQFPCLKHPELERTRSILSILNKGEFIDSPAERNINYQNSIHQLPQINSNEWVIQISHMLKACHQEDFALILKKSISFQTIGLEKTDYLFPIVVVFRNSLLIVQLKIIQNLNKIFKILKIPILRTGIPSIRTKDFIIRLGKCFKLDIAKKLMVNFLRN